MLKLVTAVLCVGLGLLIVFALSPGISEYLMDRPPEKKQARAPTQPGLEDEGAKTPPAAARGRISPDPKPSEKIIPKLPEAEIPAVTAQSPQAEPAPTGQQPASGPPPAQTPPAIPPAPIPVDEDQLRRAVVRLRCGASDGSTGFGSGIVLAKDGLIATVAHVIDNAGGNECDVIFPRRDQATGVWKVVYYGRAAILDKDKSINRYKSGGYDFALLRVIPQGQDSEFFDGNPYPFIGYPPCGPATAGDKVLHLGYSSNLSDGEAQSYDKGTVAFFADIIGVREGLDPESHQKVILPRYSYNADKGTFHPVIIAVGANVYYGGSGGLAFDTSQNCVLGLTSQVGLEEATNQVYSWNVNPGFDLYRKFLAEHGY